MATIKGTSGNDTLAGTSGNDVFDLVQGGEDSVNGLAGNDVLHFNASFDAGDQVDGGDGKDTVLLRGDYSAGVTFNAATMLNVEDITLAAGDSYGLTTNDANVAAGQSLFINAATLGAGNTLTFDGSAESDGIFIIEGGKGDDVVTGGAGDDVFKLYQGGEDTAHGGAGNDAFYVGATLDAGDTIDGGGGARNSLVLNGDYSAGTVLGATTLSDIQYVEFHSGHSYNITTNDGDFAAGATIVVNGAHLSSGRILTFNAGAESDANFNFFGGAGNDAITGGQAGNIFDLSQGGHDTAHGGASADTFLMGGAFGANDSIDGGGGNDDIQMNGMGTASSLTFKATTMVNVENLVLLGGHDYVLTTNDANVAAGANLVVNAIRLGASDTLSFNGADETDGSFSMSAGAGNATLTGGALADSFNITRGGSDTIHGGGGNDTITAGGTLTTSDSIDGGTGNDTLKLNGDYSAGLVLNDTTLTSVETLSLAAGHSYKLTTADATVAAHATMTVDASALDAGNSLVFDGSAETDGTLAIKGGAGNDTITLGAARIGTIDGGAGSDTLKSSGNFALGDSTVTHIEHVVYTNAGIATGLTVTGDITGGGGALSIDASGVSSSAVTNVIDLSGATTSLINVTGGAGDDYVIFRAFNPAAMFLGGDGYNEIAYQAPQSGMTFTSANYANVDEIDFNGAGNYANISVVGDLTAGGDNAGDIDIYAGALTGKIAVDLSAVTTSEIDFGGSTSDDTVTLSTANFNSSFLDGGSGNDTVIIKGNGTDFTSHTLTNSNARNIANFDLTGANNFTLTFAAGISEAANSVSVDASALTAGHSATIDFSHATANALSFTGGAGDDTVLFSASSLAHATGVSGGGGHNTFALTGEGQDVNTTFNGTFFAFFSTLAFENGNNYDVTVASPFFTGVAAPLTIDASALSASYGATVDVTAIAETVNFTGGAGNDTVIFSSDNDSWGTVNGGAGSNIFEFNDGHAAIVSGASVTNFSTLSFADGHDYSGIHVTGDITGNNGTLNVDASAVSSGHTVDVDLSGVTSSGVDFTGGAADDTVAFGANFTAGDSIAGGGGNDTLTLDGDYSAGLVLGAATLTGVGTLALDGGHSYAITTGDGNVASGQTLTVDASQLGASDALTFDGSAETDGSFAIVISTAAMANSTVTGGESADDTLTLTGSNGLTLDDSHVQNVGTIALADGASYTLALSGDINDNGLTVDASALTGSNAVSLDLSDSGNDILFIGGAGDDTVTLGSAAPSGYDGGAGDNTMVFSHAGSWFFNPADNQNLDKIVLEAGGALALTGDITNTGTLVIDASASAAGIGVIFLGVTSLVDITGGAGADGFTGKLVAGDSIDGGAGNDTLTLGGTESSPVVFGATTLTDVETIVLSNGGSYDLVTDDATVAAGQTLTVTGLNLANKFTFDGAAETDGNFDVTISGQSVAAGSTVVGGAGDDTLAVISSTGGVLTLDDTHFQSIETLVIGTNGNFAIDGDITSSPTGTLSIQADSAVDMDLSRATTPAIDFAGGAGNDTVIFGSNLSDAGTVDGGGGTNTLGLTGNGTDVTASFNGSAFTNFSTLALEDGNNYDITVTGGFGGESGLNIDASALSSTHGATIDASGLTGFSVDFTGGAGDDTVLAGADLGNMTIDGGGGNDVLKLDGDYSAGVPLSSVSNIAEIDLTGHNNYLLTTTDATVAAGATLSVDASALGPNFGLTFDGSAETDGYFNIKGGAGDDSLTLQTTEVDNSTIDGGAGFNTVTLTGNLGGDESFNAAIFTHIDSIDYAVGSFGGELSFTGDITGDGSTLTVDETNADGFGGSGPDGDMLFTDISALTDTIDLTGAVVDDYVVVSSVNWTSLNGNGGNYNALYDAGTGPITFDAATITGFDALIFAFDLNGNVADFSGIGVAGDLTGDGGTLTIDATYSNSISIDLSQATSDIAFDGSTGDDTVTFGNALSASDTVAGGGGSDTLSLGRNNAALADTAITGVSTVTLSGGSAFAVTGDISANGVLTVDASALSDPHDAANIDFSQATTKIINFTSGAGGDRVTFSASEDNWGTVDGGTGLNNFILTGGGTASIDGASVTDFSTIILRDGGSYTLTLSGDIQGGGQTLTVGAAALSGGNSVSIDASASTDKISFTGGAGDDTFTGSSHGDTIALGFGGIDTVHGGAGDDTITVKALTAGGDFLDGGAGANTLSISGVGEADLNGATVTNIQTLNLSANDVVITGDITDGQALTINVTALSGATIDLTQATTSGITINGSAGSDTLLVTTDSVTDVAAYNGGGGSDTLALSGANDSGDWNVGSSVFQGLANIVLENAGAVTISGDVTGNGGTLNIATGVLGSGDTVDVDFSAATSLVNITGGAGGDTFTAGNTFVAGDTIDGGGGDDQVALSGNYQDLTLTATTLTNIADLQLENGSFNITTDDATVATGQVLTVNAEFLGAGNTLTFNGGAETDGSFDFQVIASSIANGGVTLTGGAGDDTLDIDSSFSTITLDDTHFRSIETVDFFTGTLTVTGDITASPFVGTLTVSTVGGSGFPTTVDVSQATTATIDFAGGNGDDTLIFGSNLSNAGTADGGGGTNTLELTGNGTDVAAGFIGANFTNFTPTITFEDGNNYHLFVVSGFAGSDVLTLDASQLSASYGAIVNVSRAAISDVNFTGGAGDDTIVFGNGFSQVGNVDGSGGTNTIGLAGSTTGANIVASFDGSEFANFSGLQLEEGDDYGITVVNGFTGNDVINIDASQLTSGYRTSIDVSQISQTVNFAGGTDDDTLIFGANIGNAGTVDGVGGANTLELTGGGSDVTTDFAGASFTNFTPTLTLENGNNYHLTVESGFAGDDVLTVDASQLSANYGAVVDVSHAAIQTINFTGGAGDDTIVFGSNLANAGTVDGGGGTNTLALTGDGSDVTTTFDGSLFSNFSALGLEDGNNYNLTVTNGFGGGGLTLDASALSASYGATVNASQIGGAVNFTGGAGDDTITFAGQFGNLGTVDGGAGNDTIKSSGILALSDTNVSHVETVAYSDDGAGNAGLTIAGDITTGGGTLSIDASGVDASVANAIDLTAATTTAFHVTGSAGNDTITIGGNLGGSTVDGGAGSNTVILDGDYSAGITLSMLTNIDEVDLTAGHSYTITLAASNASSGDFYLAGDALGAGDSLIADSTAITSGEVDIDGGAGNDTITTGVTSGNTYLDLSQGGEDTVHGGSANDSIYMGNALDTGDRIDGGGGFNTVYLEGDSYAGGFNLGAGELTNINYVQMFGNHTYVLTGDPAALNGSHFVTIDGGAMTGGSLQFDGSAVTDGAFSLYGGAGDDVLKGGSGNDTLDLSVGGEDQLAGNGGNDIINAGGGLDAGDTVDGGAGADTLNFDGDYSSGLTLGVTTVVNVETFNFSAGHSYNIVTDDATVASGATLTVNAATLGASDQLIFNGSAETDGSFVITGGAGNDVLTGGAGNDIFHLAHGGDDTVQGGAGNDTIFGETGYSAGDVIDGGTGANIFWLGGKDYTGASAVTFTAANFVNIQTIELNSSHNYSVTMNDANVPAGATMLVDGHLAASFTFDGSAETDGHFKIVASTGADVLAGGALSDTFVFNAVNYSTGTTYDAITNLNFSSDSLQLGSAAGVFLPTGIDAAITSGALSTATFNTDLATAVSSSKLAADHAVLFTADSGTLSGHTFLVVDHNGTAGYQSGADYVIDVTGNSGTLATSSFI
jgi:Ca2+-binding RTX toxin-like protein